jgi:hypothetical protein
MLKRWCARSVIVLIGLVLVACASDKDPAEKAIKAAEDLVNSTVPEASKYVPDQAKALQDSLKGVKDTFAKGDYKAALAGAGEISGKAKAVADTAAAKKAELAKSWADMSAGMPKVLDAIKSRVDILSQAKKLPAGMDKAAVDGAKSGLDTITKTWADAQSAFTSGNVTDALAKASTVKTQAAEIMTKLGMEVPAALKS